VSRADDDEEEHAAHRLSTAGLSSGAADLFDAMSEMVHDEGTMESAVYRGEDRIGALPDELLLHLMSFLVSRDAVRTCVLAKRWRALWKSVPALRIHNPECYDAATGSSAFVDELIRRRHPTPLDECDIFSEDYGFLCDDPDLPELAFRHMFPWLAYAVWCQVKVLRVSIPLLLTDVTIMSSHLRILHLHHVQLEGCSLDLSCCQVLELLELIQCDIYGDILSQSVRHLTIDGGSAGSGTRSRVSTPNLVCFELASLWGFVPVLDRMPSLVKASIELQELGEDPCYCDPPSCCPLCSCSVVLEGLSDATNLELMATDDLFVFTMDLKWCPMFGKLKTLLLNEWCVVHNFIGLVYFLQHSPILETLTIQLLYVNDKHVIWTAESYSSRELLSKHLKVVKIICRTKEDAWVHHILEILHIHGVSSDEIDIQI